MKNACVLVGLVLGLSWVGCADDGAPEEIESVQGELTTSAKRINCGGLTVTGGTGGAGGNFAADPITGGTKDTTGTFIPVAGVPFAAPTAVYQSARTGNFSYTVTGFPANALVAVRLHFAELTATRIGQRLVDVSINGTKMVFALDVFQSTGGRFRPLVDVEPATATSTGQVTIAVSGASGASGASGTQGMLSGYEVFVRDCGAPTAPSGGGTFTTTKTTIGGVATYKCPTTSVLVGNATATCIASVGATVSWFPETPVCRIKPGFSCSSNGVCASGFCVGGLCCDSACNGPCDQNACGGGHCAHKATGTQCKTVTGSSPGNNDFLLSCNGNGACVGPTFTCGLSGHTCASDGTTACCARAIVSGGETTWTQKDCGPANTCAGNYGENCLKSSDCPTGKECCFTGGYGFGWSVCVGTGTCAAGRLMCDPSRPPVSCPTGTSCQNYNGTENTCME